MSSPFRMEEEGIICMSEEEPAAAAATAGFPCTLVVGRTPAGFGFLRAVAPATAFSFSFALLALAFSRCFFR